MGDFMIDSSRVPELDANVQSDNWMNANKSQANGQFKAFGQVLNAEEHGGILPSVETLRCFKGNWIVHVGELFGCTYAANNVWGRTTSMEFQVELQKRFHRVYEHKMNRWPLFRDTLTIWRRNKVIKVGEEKVVCLQDEEMNDALQTKFGKVYGLKDEFGGKKSKKRNIFAGANYDGQYVADKGNKNY